MTSTPAKSGTRSLTDFLLADIVAIAADAIICLDQEQRITLFNEGAEHIFGWKSEEIIGEPLDRLLPERSRDVHRSHVDGFRAAPETSRRMGHRQEISGLRKNGEEFPAEAAIAKVSMGRDVVFSVVLRDITEQVALRKQLQTAVNARDDTVSVVAHDLRNPVSAVKMLSSALLQHADNERLSNQSREQLALIRQAAVQMDRLIQDLLDVTRVETGRLVIEPEPVETTALLDTALATMRPLVEGAGLLLQEDIAPDIRPVSADTQRVVQVLSNLIGNSIKGTAPGGRIVIRARNFERGVIIAVEDTGTGIAPEQLAHIFDRFWQSERSSIRTRGAGLGLPIAKGIVDAHGGRLWVESTPGAGTTFFFTLQAAAVAQESGQG